MHRVALRGPEGEAIDVVLEFRVRRVHVLPPIGKQRRYPALDLTVLHVIERDPPRGREPIEWKLLTDLPVRSCGDALEKVRWYAMRWKIETFHKILEPGCRAEESQLLSAERIANLLALFCIIAWRILWLTLAHRANPGGRPADSVELAGVPKRQHWPPTPRKLVRLGGYLGRSRDPPPGIAVLWRGLSRLADIELGMEVATRPTCG